MKNILFDPDVPMEGGTFGDSLNVALTSLQTNIAGILLKSIAGSGTVALTDDESYNGILILTGLLTGNKTVEVPAAAMHWIVINRTTGSYSVTLKAVGGAGIIVPRTQPIKAVCDGTDVFSVGARRDRGTITPVVQGTTVAGSGTYTDQRGGYTILDDRCFFDINLTWTAHTGTGNIQVSGLPVAANTEDSMFSVLAHNIALSAGHYMTARVLAGATIIQLRQSPTGGGAAGVVPMDTDGILSISGCYRIA